MKVGCRFTGYCPIGLNQLNKDSELSKKRMENFCSVTESLIKKAVQLAIANGLNENDHRKMMRINVEIGDRTDFEE